MLLRQAFLRFLPLLRATQKLSKEQWKAVNAILLCRTPALGGELHRCDHCGKETKRYHSCRNRHCPVCQGERAWEWVQKQMKKLLPVPYFHVVFTVPEELHTVFRYNKRLTYDLLFRLGAETLQSFFVDPRHVGAQGGFLGVLHTWGQMLQYHPHVHWIVPSGGVDEHGNWVEPKRQDNARFLLPVLALSEVFRGKLLSALEAHYLAGELEFPNESARAYFRHQLNFSGAKRWNVYAKKPFAGPAQVIRYLSGYTHRIGLSPKRILRVDADTVTFSYKDPSRTEVKELTLSGQEFLQRFLQHVLPHRFRKIRTYGWYSGRRFNELREGLHQWFARRSKYAQILSQLLAEIQETATGGVLHSDCSHCKEGTLSFIQRLVPVLPTHDYG